MKRFLSMLMTLVLLCGCFAMAEVKTFDYKVLEGLDGYSYDKFEKMWSLAGEYRIKAADGYISVLNISMVRFSLILRAFSHFLLSVVLFLNHGNR